MSFAGVCADPDLGGSAFTIFRQTWQDEGGIPMLIDTELLRAEGMIQPASPTELKLFPEEFRHEYVWCVYSCEPLSIGEAGDDCWTSADEILFGNMRIRLFQARPWPYFGFWVGWGFELPQC